MSELVRLIKLSKELIANSNYEIHILYCEKNLTECSYCHVKMSKKDLDFHVIEERGDSRDLVEAISKGRIESI